MTDDSQYWEIPMQSELAIPGSMDVANPQAW